MKTIIKNIMFITIALTTTALIANNGKDIFDRYCTVCHSPAMAPMFGSPAAHNIDAWNERKEIAFNLIKENLNIEQITEQEKQILILNKLLLSAKNGTENGMPPMGTCMDCSDEDLKNAIIFMMSQDI